MAHGLNGFAQFFFTQILQIVADFLIIRCAQISKICVKNFIGFSINIKSVLTCNPPNPWAI
ncbi:hypothetical protein EAH81_03640 [Flavobacterium pectinovorum]|uniref:Uncharacterized protein n=1 Tax=Flavobacterium pectinovorum TaxID=29533 RepID=A0A502F3Z6_9FLAO|nr:hypothetical protein EAH81_03640 [Flavobacterium pectinovorum]